MKKIRISVETKKDYIIPTKKYHSLAKVSHNQIRLACSLSFLKINKTSLSEKYFAIVDTGSPISVVPYLVWKYLHVEIFGERELIGFNAKADCRIQCEIGFVLGRIHDIVDKTNFVNLKFLAYLTPKKLEKGIPLVLGYDRCLEKCRLEVAPPRRAFSCI